MCTTERYVLTTCVTEIDMFLQFV